MFTLYLNFVVLVETVAATEGVNLQEGVNDSVTLAPEKNAI